MRFCSVLKYIVNYYFYTRLVFAWDHLYNGAIIDSIVDPIETLCTKNDSSVA